MSHLHATVTLAVWQYNTMVSHITVRRTERTFTSNLSSTEANDLAGQDPELNLAEKPTILVIKIRTRDLAGCYRI